MDIEEIKKRLSRHNPARDRCLTDGVLYLIEQLEQVERIQVARLKPGDVVVITRPDHLLIAERDDILRVGGTAFPRNKVMVLDAGASVSAVRPEGERSPVADGLFHVLWTKAVGTEGYDKTEWLELERKLWHPESGGAVSP